MSAALAASICLASATASASGPPVLPEAPAAGVEAAPAASTTAPATQAPATPGTSAAAAPTVPAAATPAAAPAAPDIEVVNGSARYGAARGQTWVSVSVAGQAPSSMTMPCRVSALGQHGPHLYVGCDDGQVRIFAVDGARAAAPVQVGAYTYPGAVRAFVLRDGQLFVDAAPAAPPPAAAPPMAAGGTSAPSTVPVTTGQGAERAEPVGRSQRDRDADFAAAVATANDRRRLNRANAMMWSGFGVAMATYGFSLLYGLSSSFFNDRAVWHALPVAGPFIASSRSITPGVDVTLGIIQLAGVSLGGVGAGIYTREKRRLTPGYMSLRGGGGMTLKLEF